MYTKQCIVNLCTINHYITYMLILITACCKLGKSLWNIMLGLMNSVIAVGFCLMQLKVIHCVINPKLHSKPYCYILTPRYAAQTLTDTIMFTDLMITFVLLN